MLQKNDLISLTITDITNEASGVGRYEGMAVFVPGTAVGDCLEVRIVKVLKSYAYGIVERMLAPSSDRAEDRCPVSRQCGGCSLRHISYEAECRIKESWVTEHFRRIGGIALTPLPIQPSPAQSGYRNKAQYPVRRGADGRVQIGFFAPRSHRVIENLFCDLQPRFFGEILKWIQHFLEEYQISVYDEDTHRGLVRHLFLRWGEKTGETMVCLVVNGQSLPHASTFVQQLTAAFPQIVSIQLNINPAKTNVILGAECQVLYGKPTISDILCGIRLELSPLSFYQVNRSGAEKLYGIAAEFAGLTGQDVLLDLYCGAGTIGLSMASQVKEVIGVEIVEAAVQNAKENAQRNGIQNARFLCDDAAGAAQTLAREGLRPNIVLLDPPRKGCDAAVLAAIGQMAPDRVVMISCNSATAARDAAILCQGGYEATRLQAVDMFSRTAHVETVVLMSRVEGK
ncbi:MAG: 23S rRNA (uracil(1939)-C(5))-methyltransferase RlmD [Oscillospiraceae bacterium]|nr:23S rRNA (uracil(1939)-C(5))-methyltransferase RlmD [Oscillospiraceae bacterium]